MSPDEALQRAMADACSGVRAGEEVALDLRGYLQARGVAADDIEAVLASPRRLAVYRSLVRNGLSDVLLRMLPRTRSRLNEAQSGRFDADLAAFVEEVGPRTHYLRDVPSEFFAWAEPRWRSDGRVPAWLPDLAAHELAHFVVASAQSARRAPDLAEVALDRPLAFVESARLLRYAWAVHELAASEQGADEPARRDVCLLAYRDESHAVRWLELTPLAAAILGRLVAGEPLGAAVERACVESAADARGALGDIAKLLADLGERGVLLGARG